MSKLRLTERARRFVREVGIIVLGVLIALVVGEAATAVRNRIDARRAMQAVRGDMIDNSSTFEVAQRFIACADRRLDQLDAIVGEARRTGRIGDVGEIGTYGAATSRSGSWESAVANGDVLYLDRVKVSTLTDYHETLRFYRDESNEAELGWARLAVLTHVPGRIDDNILATVRQTIAELRLRDYQIRADADVLLGAHRSLGFPVEYLMYNGKPRTREQAAERVARSPLCAPLIVDGSIFTGGAR